MKSASSQGPSTLGVVLHFDHQAAVIAGLGAQLAISVNNCPPPRDPKSRMTSFKRTQRKYVQKAYRVLSKN